MRRDPVAMVAFDSGTTGTLTVIGLVLSLLAVAALTRWLPPHAYASVGKFVFLAQTARTLLANWPLTALVHFGRLEHIEKGDAKSSFWTATMLVIPSLAVGALVAWLFSSPISDYLGNESSTLLLVGGYVLVLAASGLQTHRLQAVGSFQLAAALSCIDRSILTVAAIVLASLGSAGAREACILLVVSAFLALVVGLAANPPGLPRKIRLKPGSMTRFSIPIFVGVAAGLFFLWGDFWIASQLLLPHELGCYYLAAQAAGMLIQLFLVVSVIGGPLAIGLIAEGQTERLRQLYSRGSAHLCLLASSGLSLCIVLLPILLPNLISSAYAEALPPLIVLVAACATCPLYYLAISIFNAYRRPDLIMRATLILGGTNLVLSLLLVPQFGAVGAAMAKGAALILAAGLTTRTAVRLLDIHVNRGLFYALMPATLAAAIVLFLPPDMGPLAGGVVSVLMITFALRYGRVLVKDDLRRLETVGFPRWFRSMLAVTLKVAS